MNLPQKLDKKLLGYFMYLRKTNHRNRKYDEATKRKVIKLYEQDFGSISISKQLDVDESSVLE